MSHQYEESNYQKEEVDSLKLLLFRVLNKNQLVILSEIPKNTSMSISSLLRNIEKNFRIPLSTLKLNAKILKEIGLIEFGDSSPMRLTKGGMFVNKILNNPKDSNLLETQNLILSENMDIDKRLELIKQPPTEEIITEKELKELLETQEEIFAYDGFEPSGLLHLGSGLLRAIKIQDFLDAKVDFILYVADWFAYLNNKFGGNVELIRKAGEYFIEGWKACGVDIDKVKIVWCSDLIKDSEYWETFLRISRLVTIKRVLRAVTITGRTEAEVKQPALLIYPLMQATDIFMLNDKKGIDICQLGMDQRKVNMLAREIAEKLGRKKPIAIHHHLLMGLTGPTKMGAYDENKEINKQISFKMSKSKPETCIFIHDSYEDVKRKILNAFCPPQKIEDNPIMEIFKYIVFRKFDSITIKREKKYGGNLEIRSYAELEKTYREGRIHPLDLKNSLVEYLDQILEPIRTHFEKNKKARKLYEIVKNAEITR